MQENIQMGNYFLSEYATLSDGIDDRCLTRLVYESDGSRNILFNILTSFYLEFNYAEEDKNQEISDLGEEKVKNINILNKIETLMREEKNKALRSVGIIELFCNSVGVDKRYYLTEILLEFVLRVLIVNSDYF